MELSRLKAITFDGALSFNTIDEVVQYCQLTEGVNSVDDDNCQLLGERFYYPDIISPLFDIFTALAIIDRDTLNEEYQPYFDALSESSDNHQFRLSPLGFTVKDLYQDGNEGIKEAYDLINEGSRLPNIDSIIAVIDAVKSTVPSNDPDFIAQGEDMEGIDITLGWNSEDGNWDYQSGDNSFSGAAYHYPIWAVDRVYRDTDNLDMAISLIDELWDFV